MTSRQPGDRIEGRPPTAEHAEAFARLFERLFPGEKTTFWHEPSDGHWRARVEPDSTKTVHIPLAAMEFMTGAEMVKCIEGNLKAFFAEPGRVVKRLEWLPHLVDFRWRDISDLDIE